MGRKRPNAGDLLEIHLREFGWRYEREFKFHAVRKWKADFCIWPTFDKPILIEIEGAVWTQGRHTRGSGYIKDLEKYNTAAAMGYVVFRFTTQQVLNGKAKKFIEEWA